MGRRQGLWQSWLTRLTLAIGLVLSPTGASQPVLAADPPLTGPITGLEGCGAGPSRGQFLLAATGDTFPHLPIQQAARGRGWDWIFDQVRPYLQAADLAYTNFDGAMLSGSPESGYPSFNYSPALGGALRRAGINLVSTANNHILDRGLVGLAATLKVLDEAGIAHHGAVATATRSSPPPPYVKLTLRRGPSTLNIGFLSATWGTNGIPDPNEQVNRLWAGSAYGAQGGPLRPELLAAVAQARRETELVIVAAHWGMEYEFEPRPFQRDAARQLAAAGADLILGAQPHTLQPVELIEGAGRQTLVIYSLANFLAAQGQRQATFFTNTSIILFVGIRLDVDGRARVSGYRYLPIMMTDGETRMAPLANDATRVISHVRTMLRDPAGQLQAPAEPAAIRAWLEDCGVAPGNATRPLPLAPDFARLFAEPPGQPTIRGDLGTAIFGRPERVLPADPQQCPDVSQVLITDRQHLELRPGQTGPARIAGAHLGVVAHEVRYRDQAIGRLAPNPASFADRRIYRFWEAYGGLASFGLPISRGLIEIDRTTGQPRLVQYFERVRLELIPNADRAGSLLDQVRVGDIIAELPTRVPRCVAPVDFVRTDPTMRSA